MPSKRPDRGLDFSQNALRIVRESTGQSQKSNPAPITPKNPAAVALSKLGASKGGKARARSLSMSRRKAIAKKAAAARWSK